MLPPPPAYVVSCDPARLAQFRAAWRGAGMPCAPEEWSGCALAGAASLGNAIAQYALIRHALAAGFPAVLIFEDDALPSDSAAADLPAFLADASARGVAALRLGWLPLPSDTPPPDGKAVLGSHAYALLSPDAMRDYCAAFESLAKADGVFCAMQGRVECAPRNLFAQFIPATATSHGIHGARGRFNADPRLRKIRADYADQYSKALRAAKERAA